jgi:hypothetical protein
MKLRPNPTKPTNQPNQLTKRHKQMKLRPSPHQHHSVVNRNSHLRERRALDALLGQPTLNTYTGPSPVEHDGRLKVVAEREFDIHVKHRMGEGKFSYEDAPNPINQLGAVHASCTPLVTSNDFESFMAAFNKRSNFMQAGAEDDLSDDAFEQAMDIIREVGEASSGLFDDWDDNDTDRAVWMSKFDPAKQKRMADAYEQIPTATSAYIGQKDLSVKQECLIKRDDPEWAPRVIYAGNDVFNTITGPASNIVMKRAVELTRIHGIPIGETLVEFAYSTTDVKLCEFLFQDEKFKETVEGDFSRNDREQRSRTALLYDAWLGVLRMPQWFRTLLLDLEHYTVRNLRFGFSAKLAYQLPTGTTSTTPRNSLYNATMFAVAVRRQIASGDIPAPQVSSVSRMVVRKGKLRDVDISALATILGDDILARLMRRLSLTGWTATVCDFKMVLKSKAPRINGEATLLSRRIFAEVDTPCMVPLLGKMLVRFNVRATINDDVTDSAYMAGKALSYAYECRHVPFLSTLYLQRYEMEDDKSSVRLSDLTWFTKTSNLSLIDIVRAIREEKVLISECEFGAWCCEQYDLDLEEVRELFTATVLNPRMEILDLPNLSKMKCDL